MAEEKKWYERRGDGGILDDIERLYSRKLYRSASGNLCLVPQSSSEAWEYLDRNPGYDEGDKWFERMLNQAHKKKEPVEHDF